MENHITIHTIYTFPKALLIKKNRSKFIFNFKKINHTFAHLFEKQEKKT
jgi:hypothetical protein